MWSSNFAPVFLKSEVLCDIQGGRCFCFVTKCPKICQKHSMPDTMEMLAALGQPISLEKLGQLRTWLWLNDSDTALRFTTMSGILALNMFQWSYMDILSGGELWCCQRGAEKKGQMDDPASLRYSWGIAGGLWWLCRLAGLAFVSLGVAIPGGHRSLWSDVF